jgi:cytoskeletal protein CcmA (bactofilin family)
MKPAEGSTVIGKSVVIHGQLSGSEDLYMDGEIEGSITLQDSRLTVGPNARVKADLRVRDAIVFGRVEGNVRASGRIEMRQSAAVVGDLFAARLSVEENAVIQGRVELTQGTNVSQGGATGSASTSPQMSVATALATPPFVEEKA